MHGFVVLLQTINNEFHIIEHSFAVGLLCKIIGANHDYHRFRIEREYVAGQTQKKSTTGIPTDSTIHNFQVTEKTLKIITPALRN